ncbi:MAG: flavin reductase family protein [Epsilonproteobacteria bacterium]|nr:flavin reductase family protein [Campylobacterota bacterium]
MLFSYDTLCATERYKLMSQSIVPRPVAWIVTENGGIVNAAPFSYFTGLSSQPPTVLVSIGHKRDGSPKDTLANLRETGRCTLCITPPALLEAMHLSSKELGKQESETERFGIPLTRLLPDFPPMVEGVPAAFFCRFYKEIELEGSKTVPVVLEIVSQYLEESAVTDKENLELAVEAVARVGKGYARLGDFITPPEIA